jgi:hypothetical protein
MGGPEATDELAEGADTQVWPATSDEPDATVTGAYFNRRQQLRANPQEYDPQPAGGSARDLCRAGRCRPPD